MQGERASLGFLSEALNFEHGSTSSNGVIDHRENFHSHGDNDLQDYMIANSESSASLANLVYREHHDLHRFSIGEASSSGTNNKAPSQNEIRRTEIIDLDPDFEEPSGANQPVQNVNLNAEYIELDEDTSPVRDRSGFFNGPETRVSQPGIQMEESRARTNSSVEGRRASCKRKAVEGCIGQSSSGGYHDFHHGESSSWTPASTAPPERNLHIDESRSRSIAGSIRENPLFAPAPELGNLSQSQSSRIATSGNLNIASSSVSRTSSTTAVQPPSSSSTTGVQPPSSNLAWTPYQNLPHHQRRRSELVRRSLTSSLAVDATNQRSGHHHPTLRSLAPPASQDGLVLQPGGDNSQVHNRAYSRAGPWLDRQGDSVVGAPHSFRALAAASRGRSRFMVSQMQNILDVMRRDPNNNLRLEDFMLLNQSVIFDGAAGMHDRYRDMRLDVDNMSYEELLALEERIGAVCTGVNEETISNRLKQRKYKSGTKSPQDAEPCCICQEEYIEGEDMGTLECGHEFHSQCIKEWLKQKNLCPICKTTGLNTAKKRKIG